MSRRIRYTKQRVLLVYLIARDGLVCHWCGRICNHNANPNSESYPTVEHLKRQCEGGKNDPENLVVACRKCNSGRHSLCWDQQRQMT